jgi:glycosyltransferase involved in cell wall biosynthesis
MAIEYFQEIPALLKQKDVLVTCIIPAWNEGPRITPVLEATKNYPFFYEVIVVDDGSTDNTCEVVRTAMKHSPKLFLVKNPKNLGKAGAVINGVKKAKGELIVLLDADLTGLDIKSLDKLVYYVLNGDYSMTILDRPSDRMAPIVGITDLPRLMGGERAFWKEDFNKMEIDMTDGYTIELIINMYFVKRKLRVRTFYAKDLNAAYQFDKHGLIKGIKRYLKMFWTIYNKGGVINNLQSMVNFEQDRLSILYKIKYKSRFIGWLLNPIIIVLSIVKAILMTTYLNIQYFIFDKLLNMIKNNIKRVNKLRKSILAQN